MKKFLAVLMAILVLATFAFFAVGSSDDDSASVSKGDETTEVNGTAKEEKDLTVNVGEVLKTGNLEITYKECGEYKEYSQYLAPKKGNKIIYIDLGAKNIGESDAYISYFDFNCYADDVAAEAYYGEDDGISATLSAGRSTSGKVYFEVPNDAEKIEIEYETDFWDDEKAVFIVK